MCFYTDRNLHGWIFSQFIVVNIIKHLLALTLIRTDTLYRSVACPLYDFLFGYHGLVHVAAELWFSGLKKCGWGISVRSEWLEKNPGIPALSHIDSYWLYNGMDFIVFSVSQNFFLHVQARYLHVTYTIGYRWLCPEGRILLLCISNGIKHASLEANKGIFCWGKRWIIDSKRIA